MNLEGIVPQDTINAVGEKCCRRNYRASLKQNLGDQVAIPCADRGMTCWEVAVAADRSDNTLLAHGVARGDRGAVPDERFVQTDLRLSRHPAHRCRGRRTEYATDTTQPALNHPRQRIPDDFRQRFFDLYETAAEMFEQQIYKFPRTTRIVDGLACAATGKTQRFRLREMIRQES